MSRKHFNLAMLCVALAMTMVIFVPGSSYAQERRAINLSSTPKGLPFSDGVLAGNTLYIAGQEGTGQDGKLASGGIGPETQAALGNIANVIKAAGFQLNDIVAVTVYLADIHE